MGRKKEEDDKKPPVGNKDGDKAQASGTDKNFYKIYFPYFTRYLDGIINQKMKLVLWLIRHMSIENELKYTYREIAKLSGISYQTVAETMKTLIEKDFMRRTKDEKTFMVNPRAVFRGRIDKKMGALKAYDELDKQKNRLSIKDTKVLGKELRELEEKKKRLQNEINSLKLQLLFTDKEGQEGGGEDRDGTGQTSGQNPKPEEEKKDGTAQTSKPNPRPEEEKKDGTGQTSEQET